MCCMGSIYWWYSPYGIRFGRFAQTLKSRHPVLLRLQATRLSLRMAFFWSACSWHVALQLPSRTWVILQIVAIGKGYFSNSGKSISWQDLCVLLCVHSIYPIWLLVLDSERRCGSRPTTCTYFTISYILLSGERSIRVWAALLKR